MTDTGHTRRRLTDPRGPVMAAGTGTTPGPHCSRSAGPPLRVVFEARPPALGGPDASREPHTLGRVSRNQRFAVLALNLGLVTALVVTGLDAHSLAVLAAGADYLADAGAIGVSLLAIRLVRWPRTFTGWADMPW
jgi:hypothetical protein